MMMMNYSTQRNGIDELESTTDVKINEIILVKLTANPSLACAGDVAWLSSHHMSDPSPSSSHDDGAHAVLVAAGEKMLI